LKKWVKLKLAFDPTLQWIIIALLTIAVWMPIASQAKTVCFGRDQVISRLTGFHKEKKKFRAFSNRQEVLEAFVNPKTETWTIISTTIEGCTYIVASGRGWYDVMLGDPAFWRQQWPMGHKEPNPISPKF